VQDCLRRGEGTLEEHGALVIDTGEFTGRSPKDRFIIKDDITEKTICWNDLNQPLEEKFLISFSGKSHPI
jgi:phosphoenolpyruvate carboxykinase (ATP)